MMVSSLFCVFFSFCATPFYSFATLIPIKLCAGICLVRFFFFKTDIINKVPIALHICVSKQEQLIVQ